MSESKANRLKLGSDPIAAFRSSMKRAARSGAILPNAMCLATAGPHRQPSARMMLLKGFDKKGFVFYTNLGSRKAAELANSPRASLCFWWPSLEEQVRIEGRVRRVSAKEADAYFQARPRGSQIGAWASRQSQTLASREELLGAFHFYQQKFKGRKIPRPPFWSGYILLPQAIEFWFGMPDRLHERIRFVRRGKHWRKEALYP
jgi:pyridoxamine 5'-phosphate oxidase